MPKVNGSKCSAPKTLQGLVQFGGRRHAGGQEGRFQQRNQGDQHKNRQRCEHAAPEMLAVEPPVRAEQAEIAASVQQRQHDSQTDVKAEKGGKHRKGADLAGAVCNFIWWHGKKRNCREGNRKCCEDPDKHDQKQPQYGAPKLFSVFSRLPERGLCHLRVSSLRPGD
ncbi:MAG: hypothetical protein P8X43_11550 [Maritimibacter sp.]